MSFVREEDMRRMKASRDHSNKKLEMSDYSMASAGNAGKVESLIPSSQSTFFFISKEKGLAVHHTVGLPAVLFACLVVFSGFFVYRQESMNACSLSKDEIGL